MLRLLNPFTLSRTLPSILSPNPLWRRMLNLKAELQLEMSHGDKVLPLMP
jgi:hypothetical protein